MNDTLRARFQDLPETIPPVYTTPHPNVAIPLYEGDLQLLQDGQPPIAASGIVQLLWVPSPRVG